MNNPPKGRLKAALSLIWVQAIIGFLIVAFIVAADQWTKYLALSLKGQPSVLFIPHVLSFTYTENSGAAWGMFADHRWVFMVFSSAAILLIGYVLFRIRNKKEYFLKIILLFFLGGGIGNMIDRIAQGYVVDFLKFEFIEFPVFNVADSFVTIAAFLAVIYLIVEFIREKREKKKHADS